MNHVYRLIWSQRRNGWVAVSELARGRKKGGGRKLTLAALSLSAAVAQAGPGGGQVVSGSGQISSSGTTTTITQSSQNLSLNWQSFNIAPQETVSFLQPSASAVAVNHIFDTNGTQILGHLNANGQVYLINPNGILFGRGSVVNVGGLVASTLNPNDATPGGSTRSFSGSGTGSVTNEGTINAAPGGYVVLLGNRVSNTGTIVARMGSVGFGAGSAVTLTFADDSLVSLQVDRSTLNNLAANGGLIQADGGRVIMTAGARDALLANTVNNTGVIEARTVEDHDGTITLLAGMSAGQVNVGGTLDASAPNGGNGGSIETSAAHVSVAGDARVTTAAPNGLVGSWLVDPQDFTVAASGGDITGTTLSGELANTNIELQSSGGGASGSGNVNVNDAVEWSASTTLTLTASNNVNVNANVTATGATAGLVINPNTANGAETASGTGAFALNNGSSITLSGANPSLSIAGQAYTVINSLGAEGSTTGTDLQGINGNLSGYFALGSDLDATPTASWNSGAGFVPIGSSPAFTGTFDGLGHTIGDLTINIQHGSNTGLFGNVGATGVVQNIGLVGGSVTGGQSTGALAGVNFGMVNNSYATSPVAGAYWVGGLAGRNYGTIKNSYATGAVSNSSYNTGGLVAANGTNTNSSNAHISNSYATGAVTGHATVVGGLVGSSYGSIDNTYATGSVTSVGPYPWYIGGLVGALSGPISNSYATGLVTGGANVGGLVGTTVSIGSNVPSVTNGFWNVTTSGQATSAGGGTGLTTAQMQTAANFSGFNFTTTPGAAGNNWVMVDADGTLNNAGGATGATYPMLASEYATNVTNAHQLQLLSMALSANYTLGADVDAAATAGSNDIWIGTAGFAPIGASPSSTFAGALDGLGHTISGLVIYLPSTNNVGIFGISTGTITNVGVQNESVTGGQYRIGGLVGINDGTIANSHVTGSVTGANYVGVLAGTNGGTVTNSYASGSAAGGNTVGGLVGANYGALSDSHASSTASGSRVGGLVGGNFSSTALTDSYATGDVTSSGGYNAGGLVGANYGPISNSYATGNVTGGASAAGGLVGVNYKTISNSYATGSVNGSFYVGGLVGYNYGGSSLAAVSNSYATGAVSGSSQVGGLVGYNYGGSYSGRAASVSNSYATGAVTGSTDVGGLVGLNDPGFGGTATVTGSFWNTTTTGQSASSGGTGLATAQMQQQASFAGWDFSATWITYEGYTAPLLRSFMTPLTVTASDASKTYDGAAYSGGNGVTYSVTPTGGNLLGSVAYGGSAQGAVNAGGYSITAQGLYSTQQGYIIDYVGGGLTVSPAPLTVTGTNVANKVYDGTTTASLTGGTLSGLFGPDAVTLTQAGTFVSANAGSGIAVTVADSLSGTAVGNYTFTQPSGLSANITPAPLTVTGTNVANKVYDGTTAASLTGGTLSGVIGSDAVTLAQAGAFVSPNAGGGVAVTASDSLSGTAASNYSVTQPGGLSANIAQATLTVSGTSANSKVYDGTTTASLTGGTLSGVIGSDAVTLMQAGVFASPNAGSSVAVTAADSLSGAAAGNYTFGQPSGLSANITQAPLTVTSTNVANKVYDGTTAASLTGGTLSGLIGSDAVTLTQAGAFVSANAGSGVAVTAADSLSGAAVSNYTFTQPGGLSANITPASLTVTGTNVANKVYDGTTAASLTGGTLSGLIGSDAVTLAQAGAFVSANAGSGVAVTAADSLSGAAVGNYTFTQPGGLSANITPAPLTVTGTNVANKIYDGTTAASLTGGTLSGLIGSDAVTLAQAGAFVSANAGSGVAVTASDSLSGGGLSNYTLIQPTGLTANIAQATLTYNASVATATSGQTPSGLSGTVGGFVAGDTLAGSTSGTLGWTTSATDSSPAGSYAIDGGGLTAANYMFTQASGNATALTVTAAPPIVTPPPVTPPAVVQKTPPAVAGLEAITLPSSASTGPMLAFGTSQTGGWPTSNTNTTGGQGAGPVASGSTTPSTGDSVTGAPANVSTGGPANSPAGGSGNPTVIDVTIDLNGKGKLVIENQGVNLPDTATRIH